MDIERLEAMVSQLTEANVRQKADIDRLIGAMGRGIGGAPPSEAIRIKNMTALNWHSGSQARSEILRKTKN